MAAAPDLAKIDDPFTPSGSDRKRKAAWLVLAGLSLVYLVSLFYSPEPPGPDGQYFTICAFKNATALPCPGCGLTHSFCALGKGDLSGAVDFNLMGPPLFLLSILYWLRSVLIISGREVKARAFDRLVARYRVAWLFLVAFAVFGMARIIFLLSR